MVVIGVECQYMYTSTCVCHYQDVAKQPQFYRALVLRS